MLTAVDDVIPVRVRSQLEPTETHLVTLRGLLESGFALTDKRIIAWRGIGVAAPMPLAAVERIVIDVGIGGQHVDLVVVPRQAVHVPLVLMLRLGELDEAIGFTERAGEAGGVSISSQRCGPMVRVTFGRA